jgi:hypothetical protein
MKILMTFHWTNQMTTPDDNSDEIPVDNTNYNPSNNQMTNQMTRQMKGQMKSR